MVTTPIETSIATVETITETTDITIVDLTIITGIIKIRGCIITTPDTTKMTDIAKTINTISITERNKQGLPIRDMMKKDTTRRVRKKKNILKRKTITINKQETRGHHILEAIIEVDLRITVKKKRSDYLS